ncbi:MAG: hypothetical protein AYP45_10835 [Candidatus Brocadia carolinensis]|uniref:Uncharacterized protein n=1 Tax=Candidatus Brocadia carolinensis TaxID=1004156 RepID=A0A1V4ASI0_9BACT|nr:MAG: hypothetical protein AYP45_10835 [Candidatus Brocadia caroliniensis]
MLRTTFSKGTKWVVAGEKKARQLLVTVCDTIASHKSFLLNCATTFMAVKIGIILLATITTMAFLLNTATSYLSIEMSKVHSILFAFPLTMIILLKLYFIGKILMTYGRSRQVIKSVVQVILLKGKQGMQQIGERIPADVSPLSLKKARNR